MSVAITPATTTALAVTAAPATVQVSATPAPAATQTSTATPVVDQHVTLLGQLQSIDPTIYTALIGALVLPFVHQGIKALVSKLNRKLTSTANYLIATALSGLVGLLLTIQSSGVLNNLHSPLLTAILYAGISFLCGQNVYGLFVTTRQQLAAATSTDAPTADSALPDTITP